MKEKLILLLAVVSGVVAMFLVQVYLKRQLDSYKLRFEMVDVVAANMDIPAETILTEEQKLKLLRLTSLPKGSATARYVTEGDLRLLTGRKFKNSVVKNSPVMWQDFALDDQRGGALANMVKETERAVSIPVDNTSSVTGLVEPNDHVDILGTFTFPSTKGDPQLDTVTLTILQNVTILATGKETARSLLETSRGGSGRKPGSYSTVTLLVTAKEAEMLVFAMQKGRLTLTLRNPSDVGSAKDLTNINFNYLEKKVGEFNDQRQERLKSGTNR